MTTTKKQAVDSTAKLYWEQYFGDYGRQWTKDIARKVQGALVDDQRRQAGQESTELSKGSVIPLGYSIKADRLVLDGVFRGTFSDGRRVGKLFQAQFDHDGKLLTLESRRAPAV